MSELPKPLEILLQSPIEIAPSFVNSPKAILTGLMQAESVSQVGKVRTFFIVGPADENMMTYCGIFDREPVYRVNHIRQLGDMGTHVGVHELIVQLTDGNEVYDFALHRIKRDMPPGIEYEETPMDQYMKLLDKDS